MSFCPTSAQAAEVQRMEWLQREVIAAHPPDQNVCELLALHAKERRRNTLELAELTWKCAACGVYLRVDDALCDGCAAEQLARVNA